MCWREISKLVKPSSKIICVFLKTLKINALCALASLLNAYAREIKSLLNFVFLSEYQDVALGRKWDRS